MALSNKEKRQRYRVNNLLKARESTLRCQKANPERRRANEHNRRVRLAESGGSYTVAEWVNLCAEYGGNLFRVL